MTARSHHRHVPKIGDRVEIVEVDTVHTEEWIVACTGAKGVVTEVCPRAVYVKRDSGGGGAWCTKTKPARDAGEPT